MRMLRVHRVRGLLLLAHDTGIIITGCMHDEWIVIFADLSGKYSIPISSACSREPAPERARSRP